MSARGTYGGFALIEIVLSLAALGLVLSIGAPVYLSLQTRNDLDTSASALVQNYRRAQSLARASRGDSPWGVSVGSTSITLFKGASWASRDQSYDEETPLSASITPSGLLSVVFAKFTGIPNATGTTTLTASIGETRSVFLNARGLASSAASSTSSGGGDEGGGSPALSNVTITDDWESGFCADVDITTESETPIAWSVDIVLDTYPLNGEPYDVWNATWSFADETLSASGVGWNDEVSAETPRSFGFCANRPPAPPATVETSLSITTDWGSGYCANVDITTDSEAPVTWEVDIALDSYPTNGTPYTVWNATWSFSSGILSASGVGWNDEVSADTSRQFGFCANR